MIRRREALLPAHPRYEVCRKLGSGGSSSVYLARDLLDDHLNEALALQRATRPPPALALLSADLTLGPAEAARALQRVQPELRVLLLSRHGDGDGVVLSGSFEALAARVRHALDSRPG